MRYPQALRGYLYSSTDQTSQKLSIERHSHSRLWCVLKAKVVPYVRSSLASSLRGSRLVSSGDEFMYTQMVALNQLINVFCDLTLVPFFIQHKEEWSLPESCVFRFPIRICSIKVMSHIRALTGQNGRSGRSGVRVVVFRAGIVTGSSVVLGLFGLCVLDTKPVRALQIHVVTDW